MEILAFLTMMGWALLYTIGALFVGGVLIAAVFVIALIASYFRTAPIPEPTYDSSVKAPKSVLPGIIVLALLGIWLGLNIAKEGGFIL